jgi:DNA invertase Pin-like site-specific DNA recombinase
VIHREFKLQSPYRVAIYARMSDKRQNQRSPQQQRDHIIEIMRRYNCPWTTVKVYQDAGIKGRYMRRRAGLQELLRDIEVGLIQIDLIVVDNLERFGRADEVEALRLKLRTHYGVLIVAADNNFADPTGITGKAVGMVEQIRSTEEGRIKGLNVIRGKKDALRLKRWPGGPAPLGYKCEQHVDRSGPHPRLYSILIEDPNTAWIIRRLFEQAQATGWRGSRLARWLNADPHIPDALKPFYAPSVDYMLSNSIYIGVGVWGALCTDIIDDARVIEPNPHPEEIVRVDGFCPPLVTTETYNTVQAIKAARARPLPTAPDGKLIEPTAGGISLTYMLAGLVKCACGACRVPRTSGRKSKAGTEYTYYACPRHNDGACPNGRHIREQHLSQAVIAHLRRRLFPQPAESGTVPAWFGGLVKQVEQCLETLRVGEPRHEDECKARAALEKRRRVRVWTRIGR